MNIKIRLAKRKYYPIYSLVRLGNDLIFRFKRVKLDGFLKHYNINKTNRVVGYTPDFVGATRSSFVKSRNYITRFIKDSYSMIKENVSKSCFYELEESIMSHRAVLSGGYDTCGAHLREYLKDNVTEDILSKEYIIKVLNHSRFKWFKAPVCNYYNGDEIYHHVRVNPDSFPGHYTSKIYGRRKGDSDYASRIVAHKIWEKSHKDPIKNLYLWSVLGREKDIKVDSYSKEAVEVGTRVILACENPITTFLMWMSQKMNFILGYAKWDRTYNVCGEFNSSKYKSLIEFGYKYDYVLEADWTYYDSNIDTNFLEIAAAILCCGLPDDKLHKNMAYTFISSVVTKYILLPPGVVIELNRAQPSGHPAGTLINCNVNLIYWCLIGYKIYGSNYADYMRVEVYGDDTRAYFTDHKNLVNIDEYIRECGLKSDPVLGNFRSTKFYCEKQYDIDFLKRRFDETGICWNHKKMFDKFFYQSRNRNFSDQIGMVISFYESVPTDEDLKIIVRMLIDWVKKNHSEKIDRDLLKRIDSVENLMNDDTFNKDRFLFNYANKADLIGYKNEIALLEFSTFRPKYNETPFGLYSNDKILLLYCIGLSYDDFKDLDENSIKAVNRPPPDRVESAEIDIKNLERFYTKQYEEVIKELNDAFM